MGRGLWMLQSLPVQSAWQMHFPSLLQTYRQGGASTGKQGHVPASLHPCLSLLQPSVLPLLAFRHPPRGGSRSAVPRCLGKC